jgi:hypothetical protein
MAWKRRLIRELGWLFFAVALSCLFWSTVSFLHPGVSLADFWDAVTSLEQYGWNGYCLLTASVGLVYVIRLVLVRRRNGRRTRDRLD